MKLRCPDKFITQWEEEFMLLDEYLKYIENNIDLVLAKVEEKILNKAEYINNQIIYKSIRPESAQEIFKRLLYNNYFLSLWAAYESGLKEISRYLSKSNGLDDYGKYVRNIRSRNFVKDCYNYFKEIYGIEIPLPNPFDQSHLSHLYNLRNIIAHGNGRINDIDVSSKIKKYKDLEEWISSQKGITIEEYGWICLSGDFCRETCDCLSRSFNKLDLLAYEKAITKNPRPLEGLRIL